MRTTLMLDTLMPQIRQRILAATVMRPEKSWYLRELAEFLDVTPSTIQRELTSLSKAGILEKSVDGNRTYFKADKRCPIVAELRQILIKTIGLVELLAIQLKPLSKRIAVAFVYGSVAEGKEFSQSDVDLLVIGDVGLAEVAMATKAAEGQLGRAVNPVVLSPAEARQKLAQHRHFLQTLRKGKKLFLIGEEHELGKAFSR